jgi:dephospho-CoA kinase
MAHKPVLGLIGGMGSGKSLVAAAFAQHGARVISGDQLGHEALRQPDVKAKVVERWGTGTLDATGNIDRRRLAAVVFADPAERQALEAFVFPWIERWLEEELARADKDSEVSLIVLDAAVMLEAGWNKFCDKLVYIDAPREVRLSRLARQRGWTAKEVEARERAQLPLTEKANQADYTLDNSGPPENLTGQVHDLLRHWGIKT